MHDESRHVDICLLGGFSASTPTGPIDANSFERRSGMHLVAVLALEPSRQLHRDQIIEMLWPESDPQRAANQLNKAASFVRKALGWRGAIVARHEQLSLAPDADVTVDVDRVLLADATDDHQVSAAIDAYRGDVLPEEPYADWAIAARETIRQRYGDLLRRANRWEELIGLDPADDEAVVEAMRDATRRGDHAEARSYARRHEQGREAVELAPSDAVADLARAARSTPWGAPQGRAHLVTFGRAAELDALAAAVEGNPIVTIVGAGGCGKTHLARALAVRIGPTFLDGVAVCELGVASDNAGTTRAVLDGLGARQHQDATVTDSILRTLAGRSAALVLDNCEQVLASARALVAEVRAECPEIRIVATSRQPLGLDDEVVHRLAPLDDVAATDLFVAEASRLGADLDPGDPLVPEICSHLDNLPLALQLAGARAATIDLTSLRSLVDDQLQLRSPGEDPRALPHHRTLEAAFAWSYDALSAELQSLLRSLAVFANPFDAEAAVAVAPPELERHAVIEGVAELVRKSLVERMPDGYRMLESVRSFARSREGDDTARDRHLDHWIRQANTIDEVHDIDAPAASAAFDRVWNEIRSAHHHAVAMGEGARQHALLAAVARHAIAVNRAEVGEWCRSAAGLDGAAAHRARAMATGALLDLHVRAELDSVFRRGADAFALAPEDPVVAWAHAYVLMAQRRPEDAIDAFRAVADDAAAGRHLVALALVLIVLLRFQHGLAPSTELDELGGLLAPPQSSHDGVLLLAKGLRLFSHDPPAALETVAAAIDWSGTSGLMLIEVIGRNALSALSPYVQTSADAADVFVDHLDWATEHGMWASASAAFLAAVPVLRQARRFDLATLLMASRASSAFVTGFDQSVEDAIVAKLREEFDDFDGWWARGTRTDVPTASAIARSTLAEIATG